MNTSLRGKAAMGFDDFVSRYAGPSLKGVDILRDAEVEQLLLGQESNEGVCQRRRVISWIELAGQRVKGQRILTKEVDIKHRFGIRQIES